MKVAEKAGFELATIIGVASYASGSCADVHTRAFAVGIVKSVNRQNPKDVQVLAIKGGEKIRFFHGSPTQKRRCYFASVEGVLGGVFMGVFRAKIASGALGHVDLIPRLSANTPDVNCSDLSRISSEFGDGFLNRAGDVRQMQAASAWSGLGRRRLGTSHDSVHHSTDCRHEDAQAKNKSEPAVKVAES